MKTNTPRKHIQCGALAALAFVALAVLPGCTSEDNSTSGQGSATLSFTLAGIGEGEAETLTRTQAEAETVTEDLGGGLYLTCTLSPDAASTTKASTTMASGTKYTLVVLDGSGTIVGSADGVVGTQTPSIQVDAGTYTVVAYSYNDSSSTLPSAGAVGSTIGSITAPAGTDLLYSSQSVTVGASESQSLPITFARKSSKVSVVLDASSMSANVAAAAATLGNSYGTSISLADGTIATSGSASATAITWPTLGAQSVTSADATLYSAGDTPLTLAFSSLTIGSTAYGSRSTTFSRSLETGKSYTLTVNVHQAIPATITLGTSQAYFVASVYDQDYLPYTAPTSSATTATQAGDGTTETLVDYQGSITTTGVTVNIPATATGDGTLPAYSTTMTIPASLTSDGISRQLNLSWTSQSYTSSTTYITATIKAVGGTLNAIQLDINAGIGSDHLGYLLGTFTYPYDNAGNTTTYQVRDIPGIPDKKFVQYDSGNTSSYEHNFLYLPVTGEDGNIWLSNNLGADYANLSSSSFSLTGQATAYDDYHAYGSLFQWGRDSDGHELITWTSTTTGTAKYGTTSTTSSTDTPSHALFITSGDDWRSSKNDSLWQGVSGTNNPCPDGFRLPTNDEITALFTVAGISNYTTAASSKLRFSVPGLRNNSNGTLYNAGSYGYCWSSSVFDTYASYRYFYYSGTNPNAAERGVGFSVRCIKN